MEGRLARTILRPLESCARCSAGNSVSAGAPAEGLDSSNEPGAVLRLHSPELRRRRASCEQPGQLLIYCLLNQRELDSWPGSCLHHEEPADFPQVDIRRDGGRDLV